LDNIRENMFLVASTVLDSNCKP